MWYNAGMTAHTTMRWSGCEHIVQLTARDHYSGEEVTVEMTLDQWLNSLPSGTR